LRNTLGQIIDESILKELGVSDLRPEQLAVEQFITLAKLVPEVAP
jgi:16S rRNA A1518/A1519 N6-dimethyltransferase RsmA/KsgA/DIM1 with predicted DNA glycosylase/AP lyase activity